MKLLVTKEFSTRVERSERVLEIAESFGIGLTDDVFTIYKDFEVDVEQGDVIYINGQSGSGKSLLLRDLSQLLAEKGKVVGNIDEVELRDVPLIDQIGEDMTEGLELLNQAGINDAYLFIRKPCELSDGQRYRFRLAKMMEMGANVWVADEFAAVLDRETAKVVSYNVRRAAGKTNATVIVATTHTDLVPYLAPTVSIEKLYGERVDLKKLEWVRQE